MKERCPTCGRLYAKSRRTKYSTQEERRAASRAAHEANARRRAGHDQALQLPDVFGSRDVGEALRRVGRHWSDLAAVINRGLRFGWLEEVEPRYTKGGRVIRQYRRATELGAR